MPYQRMFEQAWDSFATTDSDYNTTGLRIPFYLPEGFIWRIDRLVIQAETDYAVSNTVYQTFTLYNSSGNALAQVANGPTAGGLAIGPNATGVTSTITSTYQYIDCRTAASYVYVKTASTSTGVEMVGVKVILLATPQRKGLGTLS